MSKMHSARFGELLALMTEDEQKAFEEKAFRAWMAKVDAKVAGVCGLSVHDLPDIAFRDYFEDGMAPGEVAAIALEEAGMDEDMLAEVDL